LSQVKEFVDSLENIEYDENGEPTFDSFAKAINIKDVLNGEISEKGIKREAGAVDSSGKEIHYPVQEAVNKSIEFNENNP
jgi:hypothetical protein